MSMKAKIEDVKQDGRFKSRIIYALLLVVGFLAIKISQYPDEVRVYTAPDVTKSFVQITNEIPSSTVYGFARSLWELIYYCQDDCGQEFLPKIRRYQQFLTSSCYEELSAHYQNNRSLYSNRTRRLLPVDDENFSNRSVRKISDSVWEVPLEYTIVNDVRGIKTRQERIKYPLRIVRSYSPPSINPWGLAIDCFYGGGIQYLGKE